MSTTLEKNQIMNYFMNHIHCSQIVAGQWAEEVGMDKETMMRMAAPFGGGCFEGTICGAVAGALMVLGAEYGHCSIDDHEGNERMIAITKEFKERFAKEAGSLICKELIGFDFSVEGDGQKAAESGVFMTKCTGYVNLALEILDDMLG